MTNNRVIAVATSASPALKNGKKTGLWLSELTHFLGPMVDAGFDYAIASPKGGRIPLDEGSATVKQRSEPMNARFLADATFNAKLENSLKCSDVDPFEYDAIYLSGGHGTMFDFRQSESLQTLIRSMYQADAFVTGVCHGVSGLIETADGAGQPIVKGRSVTGFSNIEDMIAGVTKLMPFLLEDELKKSGAHYRRNLLPFTERVEIDGKLITGQNPQSARGVGRALLKALGRSAPRAA